MSVDPTQFPLLPNTMYGPEQLHHYLASLVSQGQTIYRDPGQANVFYIVLTDEYRIRISVSKGRSELQLHYLSNMVQSLNVTSLPDLEKAIAALSSRVPGAAWPNRPTSGRLKADTPATNYRTIGQLIGTAKVTAIFDPYLDNKTLEELRVILSFGDGAVADGVRILGGIAKSQGKSPTFTPAGIAAWLEQQGINGEARTFPAQTEHRRFFLLSDGNTLVVGHSLNAPHKNEAVRTEASTDDQPFFEEVWNSGQPL
jgi:hypothetical protein